MLGLFFFVDEEVPDYKFRPVHTSSKHTPSMNRAKSAPANLCAMAHRKACRTLIVDHHSCNLMCCAVPAKESPPCTPRSKKNTRVGEADAMSEVVASVAEQIEIHDGTEQLFIYMMLRVAVNMKDVDWHNVASDIVRRLFVSFVTHQVMATFVHTLTLPHIY